MPRRAVSPVALETCSPSPSEIDPESDLLGSDEELNDEERAAKRQRIEKLARAHLQGRPLFILSASLKGPFGDGWSNPWKKNRRKNQEVNPGRTERNTNRRRVSASPEPVVQETDPQPLRFSRNSVSGSRSPAKQAPGPGTKLSTKPLVPDSASPTPNGARKTKPPSARPARTSEKSRPASTSKFFANTSNDQLPDIDEHTFAKIEPTDWLKRDGRRSNFHSTGGLPSSPTPKGSRKAAVLDRGSHSAKSTVKEENALSNPQNHAPSVNTPSSPSKRSALTTSSFNVVSSTSQLPRFEYRKHRRHVSSPGVKPASHRRNSRAEDCNRPLSRSISQAQETGDGDGFDAGDIGAVDAGSEMADVPPERNENQPPPKDPNLQLSKSLRFATDTEGAVSTCTGPPPSTEQNTYPELPSAQEVPGPLGVSDRAISLHSTVVPKDTNTYQKTSPDTQLSTQAALMHAQRSFQDDLSSPPDQHGMTPLGRKEIAELGNDSLLARETPLFRPNTSERLVPRSFREIEKDKFQAMSTQHMIDATSPFTFSTEKKQKSSQRISPSKNPSKPQATKSPRKIMLEKSTSPVPEPTPSPDDGYKIAQSNKPSQRPHTLSTRQEHVHTYRSATQTTSLPFALSGSTPATAQDGQGIQGADSFDLSQALVEAGMYLQESIDFPKEAPR